MRNTQFDLTGESLHWLLAKRLEPHDGFGSQIQQAMEGIADILFAEIYDPIAVERRVAAADHASDLGIPFLPAAVTIFPHEHDARTDWMLSTDTRLLELWGSYMRNRRIIVAACVYPTDPEKMDSAHVELPPGRGIMRIITLTPSDAYAGNVRDLPPGVLSFEEYAEFVVPLLAPQPEQAQDSNRLVSKQHIHAASEYLRGKAATAEGVLGGVRDMLKSANKGRIKNEAVGNSLPAGIGLGVGMCGNAGGDRPYILGKPMPRFPNSPQQT